MAFYDIANYFTTMSWESTKLSFFVFVCGLITLDPAAIPKKISVNPITKFDTFLSTCICFKHSLLLFLLIGSFIRETITLVVIVAA